MAFTTGNDINILQSTDTATVGAGAGNDTYILSGEIIEANQKITITDTQGTNKLQLVGGLSIASSMVTSLAVKLTLSNGAEVTLLGADTFGYTIAGNDLTGSGGTQQTFTDFVTQTLGLSSVPTGSNMLTGFAKQISTTSATTGLITIATATAASAATGTTVATAAADIFGFDVLAAKAQSNNTQVSITGFNTTADKLQFNLTTASGNMTLAALDALDANISAQADPFTGNMLVNFGADANGDLVTLTLAGVTDTSLVSVNVV